jgi:diguanylate cyclase (GGDEF)-like protein/PAS domain S-box-containing protein
MRGIKLVAKSSAKGKTEKTRTREKVIDALNKMLEIFCSQAEDTFEEVLAKALHPIANLVAVDKVVIYHNVELNHENRLKQIYRWDKAQGKITAKSISYLPNSPTVTRWVETLLLDQCLNRRLCDMSEGEIAFLSLFGVKSFLAVPVFVHNQFWGSIVFQDHKKERYFDEENMDLIRSAARLCVISIIRAEMRNDIADKNEINRIMFDAAPVGLVMFDDELKYVDCNKTALQIFGITKRYYLNKFFDLSPEYQPDGSKSLDKQLDVMKRTINGEKNKLEWMHISSDGEMIPCEITLTRMKNKGKYFGLSYIYDLRNIRKLEQSVKLLESEVDKIYYDPLTGIYNRRYFDQHLQRIIKSLSRSNSLLSLMMIDIDRFKKYNDTYGHKEGDNCLKIVAETLGHCIMRVDDFVARYGGEEFAVVLPNTDEDGARQIAERLLDSIRNCNIPHGKSDAADHVTISIGVTVGIVDLKKSGDDYIRRADEMLYESKKGGRNRYSFAPL